jgi:hypothetical protein
MHSSSHSAARTPTYFHRKLLAHTPHDVIDLNFIFDNHLLLVKAVNQEPGKTWQRLGRIVAYTRVSGSGYNAQFFSRAINFGETLLVLPRLGADFRLALRSIKYWVTDFSLEVYQYEDEPLAIEEGKLIQIETSLIQMSATLESLVSNNP